MCSHYQPTGRNRHASPVCVTLASIILAAGKHIKPWQALHSTCRGYKFNKPQRGQTQSFISNGNAVVLTTPSASHTHQEPFTDLNQKTHFTSEKKQIKCQSCYTWAYGCKSVNLLLSFQPTPFRRLPWIFRLKLFNGAMKICLVAHRL